MSEGEDTKPTAVGTVEEVLPNSLFRVRLIKQADPASEGGEATTGDTNAPAESTEEQGELVLAYLAGKMRLHRIRVLVGDQVDMVLDPYGGRARIVRRLT
jgi:translation initiation factor IF-1